MLICPARVTSSTPNGTFRWRLVRTSHRGHTIRWALGARSGGRGGSITVDGMHELIPYLGQGLLPASGLWGSPGHLAGSAAEVDAGGG